METSKTVELMLAAAGLRPAEDEAKALSNSYRAMRSGADSLYLDETEDAGLAVTFVPSITEASYEE